MMYPRSTHALVLAWACLPACAPAAAPCTPAPQAPPPSEVAAPAPESDPEESSGTAEIDSVRLQETTGGGRIAEIFDTNGAVIKTLAPGEFSQILEIPDVENNSAEMVEQEVSGTDIVAVSLEEGTGRILIAVRGFIYAEVSTDLVFLLEPDDSGGETDSPDSIEPVYFDGPDAGAGESAPRPHLDVSRVSFGRAGHLIIETADASGGSSRLVYDAERAPESCTWKGGESRRCPKGVEAQ